MHPLLALNRRGFLRLTSGGLAAGLIGWPRGLSWAAAVPEWDPRRPLVQPARPLMVQPVFMYRLPERREQASWKSWGGIQTRAAVTEELARITQELSALAQRAEFPVQFRPVRAVETLEQAARVHAGDHDAVLLYACTGGGDLLRACFSPARDTLIFVRRRSGPVYYWYEALSVKYLTPAGPPKPGEAPAPPHAPHVDDVIVDDADEVQWRLRALSGVKNLRQTRIVALGGAWGKYSPEAPAVAREKFGFEIRDVSYEELGRRLESAFRDAEVMGAAERAVTRYLALPGTALRTERSFLVNAFVLHRLFRQLLAEHEASAFTIQSCMGTIIPMSKTTACLTLSVLNDEGYLAFCESDFVIIPAGVLLRYLTSRPVFLHNSTFPHQGLVTCAHCTAPRRLDGQHYNAAEILTHYESDYGAAPKVEIPAGQEVSFVDPEYSVGRWVGFKGVVRDNPFYEICRTQQEVALQGRWEALKNEARDSHWIMVYGDFLRETGYAARKLGLTWTNLSTPSEAAG